MLSERGVSVLCSVEESLALPFPFLLLGGTPCQTSTAGNWAVSSNPELLEVRRGAWPRVSAKPSSKQALK